MIPENEFFLLIPLIPLAMSYFIVFRLLKNRPLFTVLLVIFLCGFTPKSIEQMNETIFEANFTAKNQTSGKDAFKFFFGQPHWSKMESQDQVLRFRFGLPLSAMTIDFSQNGEGWQGVLEMNWTIFNLLCGSVVAISLLLIRFLVLKPRAKTETTAFK